tara:strand:- start:58 stop:237 length:180 start_codon:yes stop_codon:yes gene_type:complete
MSEDWKEIVEKVLDAQDEMCDQLTEGGFCSSDFNRQEEIEWLVEILEDNPDFKQEGEEE